MQYNAVARRPTGVDVVRGIAALVGYIDASRIPFDPPLVVVLVGASDPAFMARVVKQVLVLRYPGWRGSEYEHLLATLPPREHWQVRWPRGMEAPYKPGLRKIAPVTATANQSKA